MSEQGHDESTVSHRVEISEDDQMLASAEVSTSADPHGTAHVAFHAESGHLPAGTRAHLVDAVLDLPEVSASDHLVASVPTGDVESMLRLEQRTIGMRTHLAGCTAMVDADLDPCGCPDPAVSS